RQPRRFQRSVGRQADHRQGRLDRLAADPVQLRHDHPRSGALSVRAVARRLARDRRSGPRRARAADLRLPHLGAVRAGADDRVLGDRGGGGRGAGGFRRLCGSRDAALYRDLVRPAGAVHADHPGDLRAARFLVAPRADAAVLVDGAGRCRPRRIPPRAQLRLCAGGAGARGRGCDDHVPPRAAERDGSDDHLYAVHPQRLDHDADLARLSRLRPATRVALARRASGPGQEQPPGAVARHHRVSGAVDHAQPSHLCRRGGARRFRPAQGRAVSLLEIRDLSVTFSGWRGAPPVQAVKRISFSLEKGETLALVGESGSGKSVTALSVLQLLPYPAAAHDRGSSIKFAGEELVGAPPGRLREVRGNRIGMIFQEPMTSLNPLHTLEKQIAETLFIHRRMSAAAARKRTIDLLHLVGLRDAENRLGAYPHQLSGGQRQRVMIAIAIANEPDILIADEPTTALDVTIQAQILKLMHELRDRLGMALLLITHDLGIVRRMADRVCVMTHGEIVEAGPGEAIFTAPQHAYTRHLLSAEPKGRAV